MTGHYISFNCRDRDNFDKTVCHLELGIFLNESEAQKKADELNIPIKMQWEIDLKREKDEVKKAQKKWDVLQAAGIAEGKRPILPEYIETEWEPSSWDGYYSVDCIEIHPM